MGAYQYIQELWRKKQSNVMHFLLTVHCWKYRQQSVPHRAPALPGLVQCTGWDTRPSKVMLYTGFVCAVVAANTLSLRVQPMASLSIVALTG